MRGRKGKHPHMNPAKSFTKSHIPVSFRKNSAEQKTDGTKKLCIIITVWQDILINPKILLKTINNCSLTAKLNYCQTTRMIIRPKKCCFDTLMMFSLCCKCSVRRCIPDNIFEHFHHFMLLLFVSLSKQIASKCNTKSINYSFVYNSGIVWRNEFHKKSCQFKRRLDITIGTLGILFALWNAFLTFPVESFAS